MINDIKQLEPQAVFSYFAQICAIPHISGHEEAMGQYLMRFAATHNLPATQDEAGNVIIEKKATAGREDHPLVILQGHQDMVPAKRPDSTHNFLTDPICPVVRGHLIYADGTSLGADDGIGMAMILALLADDTLQHGPLRAIFTTAEETSMKGACNLSAASLQGKYLLNLDSEEDGYLFIASAGSQDLQVIFTADPLSAPQEISNNLVSLKLHLTALSGGHSGTDIHLGRANAITLMTSLLLSQSAEFDFYLESAHGGTVRNAIANQATFCLAVAQDELEAFKQALLIEFARFKLLYQDTDPHMRLEMVQAEPTALFSFADTIECLSLIENLPCGPVRPFSEDKSVVETSCNVGIIATQDNVITISLMARSLNDFALDLISDKVASLCYLSDKTEVESPHREGCWQSPANTPLIATLKKHYHAVTGREMKVTALHAGLETAAFVAKNPNLQLVSLGPTVNHPHSADEHCDILAVQTCYETLRRTLAEI